MIININSRSSTVIVYNKYVPNPRIMSAQIISMFANFSKNINDSVPVIVLDHQSNSTTSTMSVISDDCLQAEIKVMIVKFQYLIQYFII